MATIPEPRDALDEQRQFTEERNRGIGATDTPKILGLSRYGTAYTVWERLTSPPNDEERSTSLPAWMGLQLQHTIGELYSAATGNRVRAAKGHYVHKKHPWLVCHLDYRVWGSPFTLVEAKTRAHMKGWGPDGSAHVPEEVWVQVQHEMAVTGATECHVAVLFGHHTFRVYVVPRDDVFIAALIPRLGDFWENHVVAGVPPPYTGHPLDAERVAAEYPEHGPIYRNATPAQEQAVTALRAALATHATTERELEEAKTRVKDIIGSNLGLIGQFGRITWARTADQKITDWGHVAQDYRVMISHLLDMAHPEGDMERDRLTRIIEEYPGVEARHTRTQEGHRRFTHQWYDEN